MKKKSADIYELHLSELENLLLQSQSQKDPAYWLYLNKARVSLFMLEALTRLLAKTTGDTFAKSWSKFFKKLEDTLGGIDYYDVLIREFSANKTIKKAQVDYLLKKRDKSLSEFNKKLERKEFYIQKLNGFRDGLPVDFKNKALLINLHEQIKTEILLAEEFFNQHENGFTNFEEEVHEVRRKLRWISIYSISLGGLVILKDTKTKYPWEKEFITKTETQSKYNKLPVKKGLVYYIPFNKKAFFALSHVIDKLGIIKDKGLAIEAIAKSLEKTQDKKHSGLKIHTARGLKQKESENILLKQAYDLLNRFFAKYKIHLELMNV